MALPLSFVQWLTVFWTGRLLYCCCSAVVEVTLSTVWVATVYQRTDNFWNRNRRVQRGKKKKAGYHKSCECESKCKYKVPLHQYHQRHSLCMDVFHLFMLISFLFLNWWFICMFMMCFFWHAEQVKDLHALFPWDFIKHKLLINTASMFAEWHHHIPSLGPMELFIYSTHTHLVDWP